MASCQEPATRKPPAEVPISEYRVEGPAPEATAETSDDASAPPSITSARSTGDGKSEGGGVATKLDMKNGFAGAQLGAPFKSFKGLKQSEKTGDRITYRSKATPSYGGYVLKDMAYVFNKGKLAGIQFGVRSNGDCKSLKESLERELGAPQATSSQASVWKGEKVGLRFAIAPTSTCGGSVVSKEFGDSTSWGALEP